jgi:ankyrin repeat protein
MSTTTTSSNSVTSVRKTASSVADLVRGDIPQLLAWMASKHFTADKLLNLLILAAGVGRTDICLAIIGSTRYPIMLLAVTLTMACYHNQLTLAKIVVKRYRSMLNFQHLYDALLEASSKGHSEIVQWLLGEMKLSHDDRVRWLLATASARGDIDTVKLLTTRTASQAIHDTSQALRCACYNGKGDVVEWLMAHTACSVSKLGDLDADSCGKMTSLTAACYNGHADVVKTLLQCVTPHTVNIQCGRYNDSALHTVIWHGHNLGENRLHTACHNNDIQAVKTLVYTNDNDVNGQDNGGYTPLHYACNYGNVDIVESLLSVFANINSTDDNKQTPVELAKYHGNKEVVLCFSQFQHL